MINMMIITMMTAIITHVDIIDIDNVKFEEKISLLF